LGEIQLSRSMANGTSVGNSDERPNVLKFHGVILIMSTMHSQYVAGQS
jgi:hypothetical protein